MGRLTLNSALGTSLGSPPSLLRVTWPASALRLLLAPGALCVGRVRVYKVRAQGSVKNSQDRSERSQGTHTRGTLFIARRLGRYSDLEILWSAGSCC